MKNNNLRLLVASLLVGVALVSGCGKESGQVCLDDKCYSVSHSISGRKPITTVWDKEGMFYDEGNSLFVFDLYDGKLFVDKKWAVFEGGDGKLDSYVYSDGRRIVEGDEGFEERVEEYGRVCERL